MATSSGHAGNLLERDIDLLAALEAFNAHQTLLRLQGCEEDNILGLGAEMVWRKGWMDSIADTCPYPITSITQW